MSLVVTEAEILAVAGSLASLGSAVRAANGATATSTAGLVPAAADDRTALTAAQFTAHAATYQAVSAQAAGAGSYAATEAANGKLTMGKGNR